MRAVPAPRGVVCLGAARDVRGGRVECPLTGSMVPSKRCDACHHLAWRTEDRSRACSAPLADDALSDRRE